MKVLLYILFFFPLLLIGQIDEFEPNTGLNFNLNHVSSQNDGCITVFPNGSGNFVYSWTNQANQIIGTKDFVNGLSEGVYKVFIQDLGATPTDSSYHYFWIGKYGVSTTLSFQPDANFGEDAFIVKHTNPSIISGENTNYGNFGTNGARAGTNGGYPNYIRFLLRFQFNGLRYAAIDSTILSLYGYQYRNQPQNSSEYNNELFVKQIDNGESWNEHTVTWNSNVFALSNNQIVIPRIGGNYDFVTNLQYVRNLDITNIAKPQIWQTHENNGYLVTLADEYRYRFQYFYSSDHIDPLKRPKLTVTFTVANDLPLTTCKTDSVLPCETCIGSFSPIPGEKYLISAWVQEESIDPNKTSYTHPKLSLICETNTGPVTLGPFTPSGQIIDGWQRIEEEFTIPADAFNIEVLLASDTANAYFDDIRMFPFDASMKSFVYDPINMRLAAELDERHYATFYEYDEEGKLVRIKKETEKGVMTIQETKSNSAK